jgi:hypothetical protein
MIPTPLATLPLPAPTPAPQPQPFGVGMNAKSAGVAGLGGGGAGVQAGTSNPFAGISNLPFGLGGMSLPFSGSSGMAAQPTMARGGTPHRQAGGPGMMPWFSRNEARGLMHTGPINSIVPGRTDRHNMAVPSGSYVIPAAAVSHLGQSNTNAGMAVLNNMFSGAGPLGGGRIARGPGAPRPPKMMGIPADRGGARGSAVGTPTDIVAAGGEYVVPPHVVARIGGGSIENGHKILDEFVTRIHKKHAKEIAKLPPPAKA